MDGHERGHDQMLEAFIAGDLGPAESARWDEHLLGCEQCWQAVREDRDARRAVQVLRQHAPPWLGDRVRFAVEVAASRPGDLPLGGRRPPKRAVLALVSLAAAVLIAGAILVPSLIAGRLPGGRHPGNAGLPAAVALVARYAAALPARPRSPATDGGQHPVLMRRHIAVLPGGQRITIATWRVGGVATVVATSGRFFPMPSAARPASGAGMAWSARLGTLTLYCVNGRPSELLAARVPEAMLVTLAARLPA